MRKTLSAAIISSLLFTACQDSDSSTESTAFDSSIVTNTKTAATVDSTAVVLPTQNTIQTVPGATTLPTSPTTTTVTPQTSTAVTAPGMNPAHGQPGHRCDIAVGAPLNSAPTKTSTPTTTTVTQPAITTTAAQTAVKTAPGMNPPHGQPGHKCDIAVGAPLNSAPAKPATTTVKTDAQSKTADATPASVSVDSARKQ